MAGLAVRALGLLCLPIILAAAGCSYHDNATRRAPGRAPAKAGIHHVVKKGENLYRIGKAYGVDHKALARTNRIADARDIRIGRRLFIPGATRTLPVEIITPIKEPRRPPPRVKATPGKPSRNKAAVRQSPRVRAAQPSTRAARTRARRRPAAKPGFAWPVKGKVTARFDSRLDSLNDGIDIAAPSGTPVRATLAGRVIYSDRLRGYGNLIIVRHRGGFASVYAHNRRNLVRRGQRVNRRQVIAEVGATGRVTTPVLHFEIRRNNVARNPLSYLP